MLNVHERKLCELCDVNMGQSPPSDSYNQEGNGLPFYQGNADFGDIHPSTRYWCAKPTKIANAGDVLISVRAPIGAMNIATEKCCIGRGLAALTAKDGISVNRYLFYAVYSRVNELIASGTGSTFKAISKTILGNTLVPSVPLPEQILIADILDKEKVIITARREQIVVLDNLVRDVFVEMFGDPVKNPKNYEIELLGNLGELKNGMNYSQSDRGYYIRCLSVGDFGNNHEVSDIHNLSLIQLTQEPSVGYFLCDGDIVFVRSNGNKALVGRSVEITTKGEKAVFSGFCIRFRIGKDIIIPKYLNYALHMESLKKALFKNTRGANIQNLNQQMLSALEIPIPPLEMQMEFQDIVLKIMNQKKLLIASLAELETAYKSTLNKAFNGELFQ